MVYNPKFKLKMQLFDSLTGPSSEYCTWVTANAYEPLVFVNIKMEIQSEYLIILTTLKERYSFCKYHQIIKLKTNIQCICHRC